LPAPFERSKNGKRLSENQVYLMCGVRAISRKASNARRAEMPALQLSHSNFKVIKMILKKLSLMLVLTFLILTSGCKTAAHFTNPDTYSGDQREPWEKNPAPKKNKQIADQL